MAGARTATGADTAAAIHYSRPDPTHQIESHRLHPRLDVDAEAGELRAGVLDGSLEFNFAITLSSDYGIETGSPSDLPPKY